MVELIIVQLLPKSVDIGHTRTLQSILGISHKEWGKHELWRTHRYPWGILTYQLATYPLHQVKHPQTCILKILGNPGDNNCRCLQVENRKGWNTGPWVLVDLQKCTRFEGKYKKHVKNTMKGIEIQTHIIKIQPFKVGPRYDRISRTQV